MDIAAFALMLQPALVDYLKQNEIETLQINTGRDSEHMLVGPEQIANWILDTFVSMVNQGETDGT